MPRRLAAVPALDKRRRIARPIAAMPRVKSRFVCQACGSVSPRWQGQCPDCAEWNTLVQESASVSSIFAAKHDLSAGGRAITLSSLDEEVALPERLASGIAESTAPSAADSRLGDAGGRRSGIGKSTLLLRSRAAGQAGNRCLCFGQEGSTRTVARPRSDLADRRSNWRRQPAFAIYDHAGRGRPAALV